MHSYVSTVGCNGCKYLAFLLSILDGDRDLIAFLNTVFRCESPDKDDERRYNYESLTINEIYTQILNYTLRFRKVEDESSTFTYWAKKAMPDFMSVVVKRRRIRDEQSNTISVRTRHLFVLDKKH